MAVVTAATSLSASVRATFAGNTLGTPTNNYNFGTYSVSYANGTANGEIDEEYSKSITFVASTPQTLDLEALVGEAARVVAFTKVKVFGIKNTHATGTLTVGNAATNQFLPGWSAATATFTIGPGDIFFVTSKAGFTVDATRSDFLMTPDATAITAEVLILGND
jgi:hypothetical protein